MARGRKKTVEELTKARNYVPKLHKVSPEEQETIINFNKGEQNASVFTYDERWQKRMEKQFGLMPVFENGFGGKEYIVDKKRIMLPRPKGTSVRVYTDEEKKAVAERLRKYRAIKQTVVA
jgi:hypothetical protein